MAYRFNTQGDLDANVRRVIEEQIDRALKELSAKAATPATVHKTRKCIKRIRAVLKLIRPGLEKARYKQENQRFRDIAATLSQSRDTDCLDDAVSILCAAGENTVRDSAKLVRIAIEKQRTEISELGTHALLEARDDLKDAAHSYRRFGLEDNDPRILQIGLQSCYGQARDARKQAYRDGKDRSFHEWRKPVQLHWRQMALFSEAWPDMFKARVEMARMLSQCLGDDHDLSILIGFLRTQAKDSDLTPRTRRTLEKSARAQQSVLRGIANPLGAMLFQESPKAHARRIYGIWHASAATNPPMDTRQLSHEM